MDQAETESLYLKGVSAGEHEIAVLEAGDTLWRTSRMRCLLEWIWDIFVLRERVSYSGAFL